MFLKKNATFFITILFSSFLLLEVEKYVFLSVFIFYFQQKIVSLQKISEKLNSKNYKKC